MKKILIILIIFCIPKVCFSDSISEYHEDTIYGSFSTKTTAAPALWDSFDSGTFNEAWSFNLGGSTMWSIESAPTRTVLGKVANRPNGNPLDTMNMTPSDKSYYYVYFYLRISSNGDVTNSNNKYFRIGDTNNIHNGGYANAVYSSSGNSETSWDNVYTKGTIEFANPDTIVDEDAAEMTDYLDTWGLVQVEIALPNNGNTENYFKVSSNNTEVVSILNGWWENDVLTRNPYIAIGGNYSEEDGHSIGDGWFFDDVYIDYTLQRVMIGDNQTFSSCSHLEIQIPTAWSDTEISFTANQGSFTNYETAYIFVINADGVASDGHQGYFLDGSFYATGEGPVATSSSISGAYSISGACSIS